ASEQKARAGERIPGRARRDARIADIEQRIPPARSAAPRRRVGIAVEVRPQCAHITDGRRHVRVVLRKRWGGRQDRLTLFSPRDGVVPSMRKAGKIQKFVRRRWLHSVTLPHSQRTSIGDRTSNAVLIQAGHLALSRSAVAASRASATILPWSKAVNLPARRRMRPSTITVSTFAGRPSETIAS